MLGPILRPRWVVMTMNKTATAVLAAAALALTGCKHDGSTPGVASDRPQQPRATSPAIAELLAGVPGSAAAIAFVDLAATPWSQIIGRWLLAAVHPPRPNLGKTPQGA